MSSETNHLSCCQNGSNSENASISNDSESVEMDYTQGNNNTMCHLNNENTSGYSFPKRDAVDIKFNDVKYAVKQFSFYKRKYGECLLYNFLNIMLKENKIVKLLY